MTEFDTIVDRLRMAGKILFVTHARPDGDGIGSGSAMTISALLAGKEAVFLVPDAVPDTYAFLPPAPPASAEDFGRLAQWADLIVIVDTSVPAQLTGLDFSAEWIKAKTVAVDHHVTSGEVASVLWTDPTASAAGIMAGELIKALNWPMDERCVESLSAAVLSDTGWLRFSNTDARSLRALADWTLLGFQPDRLYRKLYQNDRPTRIRLAARALCSLELLQGDRIAVMSLRRQDFQQIGASADETENLVNEALRISSVVIAMLLVEQDGQTRVSLRSREEANVARIAAQFGGGGHARAAGLRSSDDLDSLKTKLLDACAAQLGGAIG